MKRRRGDRRENKMIITVKIVILFFSKFSKDCLFTFEATVKYSTL